MHITYVGHGCYCVQIANIHILVDPVLTETFQDGTAEVFPPRRVDLSAMPPMNAVVITHCHPGHLEIPSLAVLDRTVQLFYPSDPTIELVLDGLGFNNRVPVQAEQEIEFNGGTIVFTASGADYPEIGCLFMEEDSSFWYQADTVVTDEILIALSRRISKFSFVVCNYPGYNHKFFTHFRFDFPLEELTRTLNAVCQLETDVLSPNFTGLTYLGDAAWINRIMFPMSADQFLDEFARLKPGQRVANLEPGDVVQINKGKVVLRPQISPFIRKVSGNPNRLFDPSLGIPPLVDPNWHNLDERELEKRIKQFMLDEFFPWVRAEIERPLSMLGRYHRLGVRFMASIVYPSGYEQSWLLTTGPLEPVIEQKAASESQAQLIMRIAASILDLWRRAEIPYYRVYYYSRPVGTVFRTGQMSDGNICVEVLNGRDPISYFLNNDVERVYHPWVRGQIERYEGLLSR